LGLNLFIACVGLAAGVNAVQAFQTTGLSFLLSGILLSQLPITVALILGKSVLKMNLILLFGAVTGARPLLQV
jgi:putative transport protein